MYQLLLIFNYDSGHPNGLVFSKLCTTKAEVRKILIAHVVDNWYDDDFMPQDNDAKICRFFDDSDVDFYDIIPTPAPTPINTTQESQYDDIVLDPRSTLLLREAIRESFIRPVPVFENITVRYNGNPERPGAPISNWEETAAILSEIKDRL